MSAKSMLEQPKPRIFPISSQCTHHTLKGQNPSAIGTALGNAVHNKTRPNGAKALIPNS